MSRFLVPAVFVTALLIVSTSPVHPQEGAPGAPEGPAGAAEMASQVGAPVGAVAALESGVADGFWLRFDSASNATLWLRVSGSWRQMDKPSRAVQDSVQEAFCMCKDTMEVAVWFDGDKISVIVVRSK